MKNTALKLISVILAVSTCLIFSGCTEKSSQQAANATTVAPSSATTTVSATSTTASLSTKIGNQAAITSAVATTKVQNKSIKFNQIYSSYLHLSVIPDIDNIKYTDTKKNLANVIIGDYDDYVKTVNTINKTAIEAKLESKNKSFFDTKSVVFHFDIDASHPEYLNHKFISISVDGNTMTIEENREKHKGLATDIVSCHVVAAEVNKSDIQSVENIVVNHHDS